MRKYQSDSELALSWTSGSDVIIFFNRFLEQLIYIKKCNIQLPECILLAPPFECDSQNYLTRNYTLRKVEFEGETPPDSHSFCTH